MRLPPLPTPAALLPSCPPPHTTGSQLPARRYSGVNGPTAGESEFPSQGGAAAAAAAATGQEPLRRFRQNESAWMQMKDKKRRSNILGKLNFQVGSEGEQTGHAFEGPLCNVVQGSVFRDGRKREVHCVRFHAPVCSAESKQRVDVTGGSGRQEAAASFLHQA